MAARWWIAGIVFLLLVVLEAWTLYDHVVDVGQIRPLLLVGGIQLTVAFLGLLLLAFFGGGESEEGGD